jgi:hypothetical protein
MWVRYPRAIPDVSLDEYWEDLDAILAGASVTRPGASLRPQGADWTYPFVADHGAHALSSTSTEHLLHVVEQVTRAEVETRVRSRWAVRAASAGDSRAPTEDEVAVQTDGLLMYLARLREACALAVSRRYGVLMALWEEP